MRLERLAWGSRALYTVWDEMAFFGGWGQKGTNFVPHNFALEADSCFLRETKCTLNQAVFAGSK